MAGWVLYGLLGGAAVDGNILLRLLRKRARLEATTPVSNRFSDAFAAATEHTSL